MKKLFGLCLLGISTVLFAGEAEKCQEEAISTAYFMKMEAMARSQGNENGEDFSCKGLDKNSAELDEALATKRKMSKVAINEFKRKGYFDPALMGLSSPSTKNKLNEREYCEKIRQESSGELNPSQSIQDAIKSCPEQGKQAMENYRKAMIAPIPENTPIIKICEDHFNKLKAAEASADCDKKNVPSGTAQEKSEQAKFMEAVTKAGIEDKKEKEKTKPKESKSPVKKLGSGGSSQ